MLNRTTILWVTYAAIIGFVVGASLFSPQIPPTQSQTVNSSNAAAKKGTPEVTAPKSADESIATYTWYLAAFTCALVVISAIQIHFLLRADDTSRIASEAAKKSADVAEKALVTSRRAWLAISNLKIIHPTEITEDGARIRVAFTIRNLGETHATNVWPGATHWLSANDETYVTAVQRFISEMWNHIVIGIPGPIIFAKDTVEDATIMWFIEGDLVKKAIRVRENDGQKFLDFSLFAAISYKIEGDATPHLTFIPYDWLNVPVGLKLAQGHIIERPPASCRGGSGYLNSFSAPISGASASVRLPSGEAAG